MLWSAEKVKTFCEDFLKIKLVAWQWERLILPYYTNPRKYKRIQLWISKKSGKSYICALMLLIFIQEQQNKNGLICASIVQQSEIIYNFAVAMIQSLPNWKKHFWIRDQRKEIICRDTGSKVRIISGSPRGKAGQNLSLVLID